MKPGQLEKALQQLEAHGYAYVASPAQGRDLEHMYGRALFPVPIYGEAGWLSIYAAVDVERAAELVEDTREPGDPATWARYEPRAAS